MIKVLISLVPVWPQTSTILQVTPEALPKFNIWAQLMASLVPIRQQLSTILQVTPEALPKFHMWTQLMWMQLMANLVSSTNIHDSSGYAGGTVQITHVNTINDKSRPNSTTNIHDYSGYTGGTAKFNMWMQLMASLITIKTQTTTIL
jgi:hypothetical protein